MTKKASRYHKRAEQKQDRAEENKERRKQFAKRQRNKKIANYTILILMVVALGYAAFVAFVPKGEATGQYDDFARCLTEKGVTMYGTDWCPHCQAEKRRFGTSFRYVNFVNCDLNPEACDLAGVEGYPTWTFSSGPSASGEQELASLAERSGCTLE